MPFLSLTLRSNRQKSIDMQSKFMYRILRKFTNKISFFKSLLCRVKDSVYAIILWKLLDINVRDLIKSRVIFKNIVFCNFFSSKDHLLVRSIKTILLGYDSHQLVVSCSNII